MARREDGFTLIETLVAIVVLSLALVALFEGLALGWRGTRAAQMEMAALQLAKSRLVAAGVETPLRDGHWSGTTSDGLTWAVTAARYSLSGQNVNSSVPPAYRVTVEVAWRAGQWGRSRTLQLSTLKLGALQ